MPRRVLYVNGGLMNRGGIESYMMNYYRSFDKSKIQLDFLVHDAGGVGYYNQEIEEMGGQISLLPQKSKHLFTYRKKLKNFLENSDYKIIHTHMDAMGMIVLQVAKECGIPIRIAHSHNTQHLTINPIKLFFLELARKQINKYATHRMACSEVAGKWLFGDASFQVVKNAIEIDHFTFKQATREKIRKEWNLENSFVIGHVGRFDTQKNHTFLLNVFAKVYQQNSHAKLVLVGEGHLEKAILTKIIELNIKDAVVFTGVREDVYMFYNAFDLFVLPSLFEGLPLVAIEAEFNGCPVILSDQVSLEAKISDDVAFLPLDTNLWIKKINKIIKRTTSRSVLKSQIKNSGYDIKLEGPKLQNFYLDSCVKN